MSKQNESITFGFHIYEKTSAWDDVVMGLTLIWAGNEYKCTIYPTYYDTYYSCNSILNSVPCTDTVNIEYYALQIDVFKDDEQEDDDWSGNINDESFGIDSIIFKHMYGNVVDHINKIEHFCITIDNDTNCEDIFWIQRPHNLVEFEHVTKNYSTGLYSYLSYPNSTTICTPR